MDRVKKFLRYNWGYLLGAAFVVPWCMTSGILKALCWIAAAGILCAVSFFNRRRTESKKGRTIYTLLTIFYGWMLLCSPLLLVMELMVPKQ